MGPERPDLSPGIIAFISRHIPVERVRELGLHKHPHLKPVKVWEDKPDVTEVPVDWSCRVGLWPGIDEKTGAVQEFALARLPCGRWLYWEGRA